MVSALVPCLSCARHVRAGDRSCPWCGVARVARELAAPTVPAGLSRAAVVLAGATALFACGKEPVPAAPAPADTAIAPAYGGPPVDDTTVAPAYGAPPPTAVPEAVPSSSPGNDAGRHDAGKLAK